MRYVKLKEEEKIILKERMRTSNSLREQQRIHCIILSSKKYRMDQLSDIFEVDRDTVGRWFDWWEEEGYEGLKDDPKSGRPRSLTEEESTEVIRLVQENPRQLRRVIPSIEERFGKNVSSRTVKRTVKRGASGGKDVANRSRTKENKKSLI